jgi:hypothetical protein
MKNTIKMTGIALAILLVFGLAGCGPLEELENDLTGDLTIQAQGGNRYVGVELTASYNGPEPIDSWSWKRDGTTIVGASTNKHTPTQAGSYTVTITSGDFNPKSSSPIVITVAPLPYISFDGAWYMKGYGDGKTATGTLTYDEQVDISVSNNTWTIRDYPQTPLTEAQKTAIGGDNEAFTFAVDGWEAVPTADIPEGYATGFKLSGKVTVIYGYNGSVTGDLRPSKNGLGADPGATTFFFMYMNAAENQFTRTNLGGNETLGQPRYYKKGQLPAAE